MNYGYNATCLDHETGTRHPESPDRLRAIKEGLKRRHGVNYISPAAAEEELIHEVHDSTYVEKFKQFCANGGGRWDPDTVATEATWDAALTAAGMATWASEMALTGTTGRETPFSLGRPPGHHAVSDDAMGFCFFNNVAIGAQAALEEGASRVVIIDFDVHHGNGTQEIFFDRDDVLFLSTHERDIYPGSGELEQVGAGPGHGTTVNIPLPAGAGDAAYKQIISRAIRPAVNTFGPDVILVSAGFDAHEHDPISRMQITTEGYGMLAAKIQEIAGDLDIGLGFILEGGYALDVLAKSVGKVHEVFDGYEPISPSEEPSTAVTEQLDRLEATHPLLD